MIIDYRKSFRESEAAKGWNNVSASEMFAQASAAAMLIFAGQCPGAEAMKGAQTFLAILASLTDPEPKKSISATSNLTHKI